MNIFSNEDIINYYDLTKVHYRRAWDLTESMAMHYGYKNQSSDTFRDSLKNMNMAMADFADIIEGEKVLDAGCGVGGSSIYLTKSLNCQVIGISLSEDQISEAKQNAEKAGSSTIRFEKGDFTHLNYNPESFDVVWALESLVHCHDKALFFSEAYRVLKPGGRIIMGEYVRNKSQYRYKEETILKNWLNAWAIKDIDSLSHYYELAQIKGFKCTDDINIDKNIAHASWRMFYGSWFLFALSKAYKLFNPNVSRFADQHYKGLFYQYLAFRKNLWSYHLIRCQK